MEWFSDYDSAITHQCEHLHYEHNIILTVCQDRVTLYLHTEHHHHAREMMYLYSA